VLILSVSYALSCYRNDRATSSRLYAMLMTDKGAEWDNVGSLPPKLESAREILTSSPTKGWSYRKNLRTGYGGIMIIVHAGAGAQAHLAMEMKLAKSWVTNAIDVRTTDCCSGSLLVISKLCLFV
jgi:hypothetical protein